MPLFIGPKLVAQTGLTVGLSRVLFPVVLLLGLNGLLVGVLQSYDHFTIPAISPAVWNVVIIVLLVVLAPHFHGEDEIYAFAIGVLVATVVQLLMAFGALGRIDFRLRVHIDWHDPRIRQVFMLMLPVTIGLGIVNLDQLINSAFGGLVSNEAPRAIDNALPHLHAAAGHVQRGGRHGAVPDAQPHGVQPRHRGDASRGGQRHAPDQPLLIPAAAFMIVLPTPIVRLLFERGEFNARSTHLVSIALFWFAFSLPFGGINLLLTRTFFAVQRPWIPTRLAAHEHRRRHHRQHRPVQAAGDRRADHRHDLSQRGHDRAAAAPPARRASTVAWKARRRSMITVRIILAAALLAGVSWIVWKLLDELLGGSLPAEVVSVGGAGAVGLLVYVRAVLIMRIPEAHQVGRLIRAQLGRA